MKSGVPQSRVANLVGVILMKETVLDTKYSKVEQKALMVRLITTIKNCSILKKCAPYLAAVTDVLSSLKYADRKI